MSKLRRRKNTILIYYLCIFALVLVFTLCYNTGSNKGEGTYVEDGSDEGISYTLESTSLIGRIEELGKVLKEKAEMKDSVNISNLEISSYKNDPTFVVYGMFMDEEKKSAIDVNYFESQSYGTIFQSEEEYSKAEGMTWGEFLSVMKAFDLDNINEYGADLIKISYYTEPVEFSKEEKAKQYDYTNKFLSTNEDGNIRQIGYYLYSNGSCEPVTSMTSMDGTYREIGIEFLKENKESENSYSGVACLGILIEEK